MKILKLVKNLDFYTVNTHELVYLKPEVFLDLNINNTSNLIGKTTSVQPMGARQKIYDTNKLKHVENMIKTQIQTMT